MVKAFLNGIPIGKLGQVTEALVDLSISPTTASEMIKTLNEDLAGWHSRAIGDEYRYLLLDGVHLKRRSPCSLFRDCAGSMKKVVLVAYGVKEDDSRELLSFRIVNKECTEHWEAFLRNLHFRGLRGAKLRLITTDEHKGLLAAVAGVYPHVPRQLCWFHKSSNVLKCVRKTDRKDVAEGLRKIYQAENRTAALKAYRQWRRRRTDPYPDAVHRLERVLEQMLHIFAVPIADRKAVRTTNAIERVFREVRKRTRPIGCFVNDASISRVIYATFMHYNAQQRKRHKKKRSQQAAA
jgi:transposase-like protein